MLSLCLRRKKCSRITNTKICTLMFQHASKRMVQTPLYQSHLILDIHGYLVVPIIVIENFWDTIQICTVDMWWEMSAYKYGKQ